jgi:general secretion pathway protein D
MRMRWGWLVVAMATFAVVALAADESQNLALLSCPQGVSSNAACNPSKADLKKSKAAFSKALKLQKAEQFDEAYEEFDTAARLVPRNVEYVTALAMVRQQLVYDHLQHGNDDLTKGKLVEAQGEFRSAANLDPENEFAKQRLLDSMAEWAPKAAEKPRVVESAEVRVVPSPALQGFHFRGDSHALLTQVAGAYGVTAEFDESVPSRRVHFDIESVDFYTAMRTAGEVTGAFWVPLSEKQIYLARDNAENHRQFDHMALRTFYMPGVTTPQEMTEMATLLRTIFDIRFVSQQPQSGMLAVRASTLVLDAVTKLFESFGGSRPQVLLDIQVFEIDHQLTRNMGLHIPNNFTLINVPAGAVLALTGLLGGALGGQNIQSLINQLISSGGINQANSQGIAGLISQLTGQGSGSGPASIFNQPYATFGGGLTLMGLSLDTLSAQLSLNESWVKTLEHSTLRAAQGNEATFRMGSRYPIINASFAPVFNTAAISSVLQNGSFQAPFPSFTYEDLGLTFKVKPSVYTSSDVGLQFEMDFRTLAGQSINGVPVIANREYKGNITLVDGEPAVVVGSMSQSEQLSLTGIPGLGLVPGLNQVMTTNTKMEEVDELLLVITPHIVDAARGQSVEVWLPKLGQ